MLFYRLGIYRIFTGICILVLSNIFVSCVPNTPYTPTISEMPTQKVIPETRLPIIPVTSPAPSITPAIAISSTQTFTPITTPVLPPLSIASMRSSNYPGSDIKVEKILERGYNYDRYIASYLSEGLKIYALLTVPDSKQLDSKFPVIIFNHGYIAPKEYKTTDRYVAYVDAFAKRGYIVFKPDYRGHGNSEGTPSGAYSSPAYTIDVLNAVSSIKKYPQAEPSRIGMWGHSMGGQITLRSMVITKDVKVGVIWAGVVAPFYDIINNWRHARRPGITPQPTHTPDSSESVIDYSAIVSPNSFLLDLSGPLQLHHGTSDPTVPLAFSETLYKQIKKAGGMVEFYTYEGDNHNIAINFSLAMYRTLSFFDRYLKAP